MFCYQFQWFLSCFLVNLNNLTTATTNLNYYYLYLFLHGLAIEVYGRWGDDFSYMFNHFISLGAANTNIPRAILANYCRHRISVCLQSRVANAINTRINSLTARTLGAGGLHSSHGEAFFPGLIEEQSEAFRGDGVPIGRDFDGG